MFQIRNGYGILGLTLGMTLFTVLCVRFTIPFFHSAEIVAEILWPATLTTAILTLLVTVVIGLVMRRNVLLADRLQDMLDRDRLTKVGTRDYFFRHLDAMEHAEGAIVMIDIDHFKRINDTHGHLVGDAVLEATAGIIGHMARKDDLVCRFGGEEFVVFLRDAGEGAGHEVAERMRARIAGAALRVHGTDVPVTASMGLSVHVPGEEFNETIRRADEALYRAKAAGRDKVMVEPVRAGSASDDRVPSARRSSRTSAFASRAGSG